MADLNSAIQLIREGRKQEAQRILEPILEANPGNIQAWFWYVETYPTLEKRIQVLEMCLNLNPGNTQVAQALQTLKKQRSAQTPFPSSPVQPSKQPVEAPTHAAYSSPYDEEPLKSEPFSSHSYFDETPVHLPVETDNAVQSTPNGQKKAWEDPGFHIDNSALAKPNVTQKSYAFYDVWMTVLASFDIESYKSVLNDPEAGAGRGFEWVAYAGIISGLLASPTLINDPRFAELMSIPAFYQLFGNMSDGALMVVMSLILALLTPIFSVLGLAISAGIQNVIALFFGGSGYYGRTVYAIAAYLAPMTILLSLIGLIPFAGQCLTSLLALYNFVLNMRALQASHSISAWQALGVMFTPTIIFIILGCLLFFIVFLPGLSS
jgi:hypothetical protein